MDLWFSEVHTPDVKLSLRTAKQLYAGKSEWQDIEVLDTPAFGKILILNGHVLFSDADDFVYNEMTVHVPMAVHPNPKKVLVIGGGDGGVAQVLTLYPELEQIDIVEPDEMLVEVCREYFPDFVMDLMTLVLPFTTKMGFVFYETVKMITILSSTMPLIHLDIPKGSLPRNFTVIVIGL